MEGRKQKIESMFDDVDKLIRDINITDIIKSIRNDRLFRYLSLWQRQMSLYMTSLRREFYQLDEETSQFYEQLALAQDNPAD